MATEFGTGKTVFVLAIVAACFAVLWPKLFAPMLEASLYSKPPIDTASASGCCDVMSDMDINAIKIITETCGRIIHKHSELDPKFIQAFEQGKITQEVVETCKREVLATCGVDITAFLAEQVRLGQSFRDILDSVRSFNSSVCLKLHFGVERGLIGAPRNMRVWSQISPSKKCLRVVWFEPEAESPDTAISKTLTAFISKTDGDNQAYNIFFGKSLRRAFQKWYYMPSYLYWFQR